MKICEAENCTKQGKSYGLCSTHARRRDKGQPLNAPIGSFAPPKFAEPIDGNCGVSGCGERVYGRGVCKRHYMRARKGMADWDSLELKRKPLTGECSVPGCENPDLVKGLCSGHNKQKRDGKPFTPVKKEGVKGKPMKCKVEGCGRKVVGDGFCERHRDRWLSGADLDIPLNSHYRTWEEIDRWRLQGPDKSGYMYYSRGANPNREDRRTKVFAHRLVMEGHIGRRLQRKESVHHKNGVRDDNRIENLELWSSSHPAGQRVEDKIAWAKELLRTYEPDALK